MCEIFSGIQGTRSPADLILFYCLFLFRNHSVSPSHLPFFSSTLPPSLPPYLILTLPLSIFIFNRISNLPISIILTLHHTHTLPSPLHTHTPTQVTQLMDQLLLLQVNARSDFDQKMEKEIHRLR